MAKIVFIGAGSIVFTRSLLMDIFLEKIFGQSCIALMDVNEKRLGLIEEYAKKLVQVHNSEITIEATTDRKCALKDADYVISSFQIGGLDAMKKDFEIPAKYGFKAVIADTTGPGGFFRGLRSLPVLLSICKDMEELCPDALLINYTNPMHILSTAMQTASSIQSIGFCHGIKNNVRHLFYLLGHPDEYPSDDMCCYEFAGINHSAWLTKFSINGKDMYPEITKLRSRTDLDEKRKKELDFNFIPFDLLERFGLYPTGGTTHAAEYYPYYIKKNTEVGSPANDRLYPFFYLDRCIKYKDEYEDVIDKAMNEPGMPLVHSKDSWSCEEAVPAIKAHLTNAPTRVHGSVLNKGYLKNLPDNFSVEIPVFVDREGFHPCTVEDLPPGPAALSNTLATTGDLVVQGYLHKDRNLIRQALLVDPIISSILTLDEIDSLFEEMWKANKEYFGEHFSS